MSVGAAAFAAGSVVTVTIPVVGGVPDAFVGAGLEWLCWVGVGWVPTHQLVREGFGSDGGPETIEVPPGVTTTIPAVAVPLPASHSIRIPDVTPGTHRILDRVVAAGTTTVVFVVVEVAAGG